MGTDILDDNTIYVSTFGGFSMRYKSNIISDQDNRSKKIWTIIEYLMTNYTRNISKASLIDLLWTEDTSSSDAPENALKTCIHRVRSILALLEYPEPLLEHKRGVVSWNNRVPFSVDFDLFEKYCLEASTPKNDDERIVLYEKALQLYKGDFLPKCSEDDWAAPLATYYHSLYIKTVHDFLEILARKQDFDKMIDYCSTATTIDSYDEEIHYYLILSLFRSGKQQAAIERYEKVIAMYYDNFGINPSRQLIELRKEISKSEHDFEADLNVIIDDLHEAEAVHGAFRCDYAVFQAIYRLYARSMARTGQSIYICLVTLKIPITGNKNELLRTAMERMRDTISSSLRTGDVYSRYSKNQYLVMLPATNYENSLKIGERILRNYDNSRPRVSVRASYVVKHLEPAVQ